MTARSSPSPRPARISGSERAALGAHGEELAADWYRQQGYRIVARNWRCRDGEIDIIAARGGLVAICEVKTRTSAAFGLPAEAVTPSKRRRLRLLASRWLASDDGPRHPVQVRFDVAAVLAGELQVIVDAF